MSKKINLIEIDNLEYKNIFKDLSIKISQSSYNILAGASLSGKTTLLKIIGGLISIDNIKYNDKNYNEINKKEILNNIKYIDINTNINFKEDNIEDIFMKELINLDDKSRKYKEIIKISEIIDITNKNINELTLFERTKLLIGLSLITNPKLILIDNLCTITSKSERKEIEKILNDINKTYNASILIATPNLIPVEYADNIYVINKGEIVLNGKKEDVLKEDNKLNRYGLDLPFIYDLSAKLIDYNLIQNMIDSQDRMVNALWK